MRNHGVRVGDAHLSCPGIDGLRWDSSRVGAQAAWGDRGEVIAAGNVMPSPAGVAVYLDMYRYLEAGHTAFSAAYSSPARAIQGAIATAQDVSLADVSDLTTDDVAEHTAEGEKVFDK